MPWSSGGRGKLKYEELHDGGSWRCSLTTCAVPSHDHLTSLIGYSYNPVGGELRKLIFFKCGKNNLSTKVLPLSPA